MSDFATLARIEDHLRRIADALEAASRETRQVDLTAPTAPRWDDCETRDPNLCDPGCTRPSLHDGDCSPAEANDPLDPLEQAAVHVVVTDRQTGATLFAGDMAKLPADLDLPQGGWSADDLVQPMADPLDESDHRPRHDWDGDHWRRGAWGWYASAPENGIFRLREIGAMHGPLTFCDCADDATIEAENGATD